MEALFWGIDRYDSRRALKYLQKGYHVSVCICEECLPDSKLGLFCAENGIRILSQATLLQMIQNGGLQPPDVAFCYSYHAKINEKGFSFPRLGTINFHPSPLPDHRGIAGSTFALLHKCDEWGVSAHYMDENFDTGPLIQVDRFPINFRNWTAITLSEYIHGKNYELFQRISDMVLEDRLPTTFLPDISSGHYYGNAKLQVDKRVDLNESAEKLDQRVSAMWYPPYEGAYIMVDGQKFTLVNETILQEVAALYSQIDNTED